MSFLKLKNYAEKIPIRLLFSKIFTRENSLQKNFLCSPSTNLQVKISFYTFVKLLKIYKLKKGFFFPPFCCNDYGQKLENNGFYRSSIEAKKKEKLRTLNSKISHKKSSFLVKKSFRKFILFMRRRRVKKKRTLRKLSKGFNEFEKYFTSSSKLINYRQIAIRLSKAKIFTNKVFVSRLLLASAKGRKKYRTSFFYLLKRKKKLKALSKIFTFANLKVRRIKIQKRRYLKRVSWRRKKKKKWSRIGRPGSWNLYRRRQRLSQIFYVPRQFEINYKTLGGSYLGFTDFKTTSTRIPFWLNLRKVLTFLS